MKRMIGILLALALLTLGCATTGTNEPETADPKAGPTGSVEENEQTFSTPPARPDGEQPGTGGTPPEPPGDGQGRPPEPPDGEQPGQGGAPGERPEGEPPQGGPQNGPGGSAPGEYTAVSAYSKDAAIANETITSTGTDENAILVNSGAMVTLADSRITRTSSDSTGGDSASFYGVGSALLVTDGTLNVDNTSITTDASGGAGVFAYGSGVAHVTDTEIRTTQGASGGLHVAGGGTLTASNCTVETDGGSSAAIRSDRGGGTMTIDGGSYTSNGVGSPAIYCTADITVSNATLTATGSEAVCIEGKNSLSLSDCTLVGNMPENAQNDCTWTVILYQSMSGDSEIGTSKFTMAGGTLESKNGGVFYTTNTASEFRIENVRLVCAEDCPFLFKCTGNANARGWGQSGQNGAESSFTAVGQIMEHDIVWDSISTLTVSLESGSVWSGAFVQDESNAGGGGTGTAALTVDGTSTWIVTGDSVLTTLVNHGTIADPDGNSVTIRSASGETLAAGTGPYTVTVSTYEAQT